MKELKEYRVKLLERLEEAAKAFRDECLSVKDPYTSVDENGWNIHQIAVHTRDIDKLVYGLRTRRTATEENPEFPNFDGEAYLTEHYDEREPLRDVLEDLVQSITALVEWLRSLPDESWSRLSGHTFFGRGLTLQIWVEKNLAHIEEHLQTVKKAN